MKRDPLPIIYKQLILWFVTIIFCSLYFLACVGLLPTKESKTYTRNVYVKSMFRHIADHFYSYKNQQYYYPWGEHYGYLTHDMLNQFPEKFKRDQYSATVNRDYEYCAIDPYNMSEPIDAILNGPIIGSDRACYLRLRGHPFYYYTDGKGFYILGSYGPDEDQDILSEEVIKRKPGQSPTKMDIYNFGEFLRSREYDSSNGTISDGDIIYFDLDNIDRN